MRGFLGWLCAEQKTQRCGPTTYSSTSIDLATKAPLAATFTAAGIVRRGLQSVGFDVKKVKGFGQKKRNGRCGNLNNQQPHYQSGMSQGQSWFTYAKKNKQKSLMY